MKGGKKRLLIVFCLLLLSVVLAFVLVQMLDSSVVAKANNVRSGMTTNDVLRIMGPPTRTYQKRESWLAYGHREFQEFQEWRYRVIGLDLKLRPFRVNLWKQDRIVIEFGEDQKVVRIWIPSQ